MRRKFALAAFAAALSAAPAAAQQGMGPGMVGGHGPAVGPGMMGGHGPGMGPGMMGRGMIEPGMMGPGMGMGPGMMMHRLAALNLTDEQHAKIGEIGLAVARKRWELMAKRHEHHYRMHEIASGRTDDAEARKTFQAMSEAHRQVFEAMLDARKRIDAVLTAEQREQLRRSMRPGLGAPAPR